MTMPQVGDELALLWKNLQQAQDDILRIRSQLVATHAGNKIVSTSIVGTVTASPAAVVQYFTNNSGGALEEGDVVVLDTSGSRVVNTSVSPADILALGVVRDLTSAGPFADGAETPVLLLGNAPTVKVTGTVAAGDYLGVSSSAGRAESLGSSPAAGAFAIAETANPSGDGTVVAFVSGLGSAGAGTTGLFYLPFGSGEEIFTP